MLARLRQNEFVTNVAKVFAGNGLVFVISLFAIPVISSLYAREHDGVTGLLISVAAVAVVFATFKCKVEMQPVPGRFEVTFYKTVSLEPAPEQRMKSLP